jgi:hypothetical protein
MKAHIDLAIGGKSRTKEKMDQEHKKLGVEYNKDSKGQTPETIIPDTPMDVYNSELQLNSTMNKIEEEIKFKYTHGQ